jgi:DNA-binding transcriptional LysR family regulator
MDALTLDQFQVFVTVADVGSFSAAARRLNRAQSAVTYAVQKLEEQTGATLFDRSQYRPVLSEAGRALLPRARRILAEVSDFRIQAHGIAGGLEAELSLVVDAMFPMPRLLDVLRDFQFAFPSVQTRIYVESLGAAVQTVIDAVADIGLIFAINDYPVLRHAPILEIELVPVAAPGHPLAARTGPLTADTVRDHVQLVLTDRSTLTAGRDHGVVAVRTWRLADLGAKHAMLLAGLGWGGMPRHLVADDLAAGRLVELPMADPSHWPRLPMVVVTRTDKALGPAGRWMAERLTGGRCPSIDLSLAETDAEVSA